LHMHVRFYYLALCKLIYAIQRTETATFWASHSLNCQCLPHCKTNKGGGEGGGERRGGGKGGKAKWGVGKEGEGEEEKEGEGERRRARRRWSREEEEEEEGKAEKTTLGQYKITWGTLMLGHALRTACLCSSIRTANSCHALYKKQLTCPSKTKAAS
jgi:hypothetical protein